MVAKVPEFFHAMSLLLVNVTFCTTMQLLDNNG